MLVPGWDFAMLNQQTPSASGNSDMPVENIDLITGPAYAQQQQRQQGKKNKKKASETSELLFCRAGVVAVAAKYALSL